MASQSDPSGGGDLHLHYPEVSLNKVKAEPCRYMAEGHFRKKKEQMHSPLEGECLAHLSRSNGASMVEEE